MKDLPYSKAKVKKAPSLKKQNDDLWAIVVKLRAGGKSEYSGKSGEGVVLCAHHIAGKVGYRLRYELDNGICLTIGEHGFIAHNSGRYEMFRKFVKRLRGDDIYERLELLRQFKCKTDLKAVKLYLESEIRKLKE